MPYQSHWVPRGPRVDPEVREARKRAKTLIDPAALDALSRHADDRTRSAVAQNVHTPVNTLLALVADPSHWVRFYIAASDRVRFDDIAILAADPEPMVRRKMLRRADVPVRFLQLAVNDPDEEVRYAAVCHRSTPGEEVLSRAADSSSRIQEKVAWRALDLGEDAVRAVLAAQPDRARQMSRTKMALVGGVQLMLARSDDQWARKNIADRADCAPSVLTLLSTDKEIVVRVSVARHANTPDEVLATMSGDRSGEVRYAVMDRVGALWLAGHAEVAVRVNAAKVVPVTVPAFGLLLDDDVESVRVAAVRAAGRDGRLNGMVDDASVKVRVALGPRVSAPAAADRLSRDAEWRVRLAVVPNAFLPQDSLALLSRDPVLRVRKAAAERFLAALGS